MVKVLVTGASGFIGTALCDQLNRDKVSFYGFSSHDGDIASSATWKKLPSAEIVVHLAGRSFVPDSWDSPVDFLGTNVLGTQQALDYCKRNDSRLIFISAYIYGIPKKLPMTEEHAVNPSNPYALSKYLAEQLCQFAVQSEQVRAAVVLRLFNVYGPGQRLEFLIPSIIQSLSSSQTIEVLDIKPRRDYVFLDDVVGAITSAMKLDTGFNILNIGSGLSHSVREVIEIIQKVAGTDLPVSSKNQERQQEIPDVVADFSKAKELINWYPRVSFEEGISRIFSKLSTDL